MARSNHPFQRFPLTVTSLRAVPALLCTVGLLFLSGPAPAEAQDPAVPDTIVQPQPGDDIAYLRLVVQAAERTASGTASAARLRAQGVIRSLEASGVTAEQLEMGDVEMISVLGRQRIGSSRRPTPPAPVIGYRAWIPITVTTPALARVDFLVGRAAGAGAYLEWVEYGVEGDDRPDAPAGI